MKADNFYNQSANEYLIKQMGITMGCKTDVIFDFIMIVDDAEFDNKLLN